MFSKYDIMLTINGSEVLCATAGCDGTAVWPPSEDLDPLCYRHELDREEEQESEARYDRERR